MCLCLQRTVPTGQSSLVLQPLLSDTEYKVAITPVYPEGDGPAASRMGRTRKSSNEYKQVSAILVID